MVKKIVLEGAQVLRDNAEAVKPSDIKAGQYKGLIGDMWQALDKCGDGVALAAPQIGKSVRVFIVSPKIFRQTESGEWQADRKNKALDNPLSDISSPLSDHPPLVYFNPVIKKLSKSLKKMDEGCLSVNGLYGKVPRSTKATIEAYDEYGMKFTRGASDLLAQIFQHEVDHLDGILYIDKASELNKLESRKTDV